MTKPKGKSRRVPVRLHLSARVKCAAAAHAGGEGKDFSRLVEEVLLEKIMKTKFVSTMLAALTLAVIGVSPSAAQTEPSAAMKQWGDFPYLKTGAPRPVTLLGTTESVSATPVATAPEQPQNAQPQVAFRTQTELRRDAYIGFNLGVNAAQQGDVSYEDNSWWGYRADGSLKSGVGYAAGVRGGYTWQLGNTRNNLLALSLEGEIIYTWNPDIKAVGRGVESGKFDLHIWALTVSPVLRFQLGRFVPYIGVGAGGALVLAANPVDGTGGRLVWDDSRYGAAFAFQGMTGMDYYLYDDWSIFAEYKYLGLVGLELNDQLNGRKTYDNYKSDGILSNHIVSVGARFHF